MRSPIYFVAALAAAGIAYYLAAPPQDGAGLATTGQNVVATPQDGADSAADAGTSQVLVDTGTLVLRVDDMHCEFACFPKVKQTLQELDNVVAVELDEQAEAGTLDNPQVVIDYEPGFDLGFARQALAKKGFAKSSVVP